MDRPLPGTLLEKIETGIPGLDAIASGGVPKGRTTLVSGTAGSAKTVIAVQFLAEGIRKKGESGVFVTFEETPEDIRRNMIELGWEIGQWEEQGKWVFVDGSQPLEREEIISGSYDFGALMARIEYAVTRSGAARIALDSLSAIFTRFDKPVVRRELFRIASSIKRMQITAMMTAERTEEYGPIARYGVEEFVADNVIILRNVLEAEKRRRTIEILKFRGTSHHKGEYPFTIVPGEGIMVMPLSALELKQKSSNTRITSGKEELDQMCGGGFFRDSIVLVSGATGTGKTLVVTEFIHAGISSGERCLFLAFEESREQLIRNAAGWGMDLVAAEESGLLRLVCQYPEVMGPEDHLQAVKTEIELFRPNRLVIDSLSAIERVASPRGFREFVIGVTSFIKHHEIAGVFTSTTPTLLGGPSITETHISTITDSIILLRYVELFGEIRRGVTVLKMRGSMHDKVIREFTIDGKGLHIGKPFRNISGILAGHPNALLQGEMDRLNSLFVEKGG